MNDQRETVELVLPKSGHKVLLKTYLTVAEERGIMRAATKIESFDKDKNAVNEKQFDTFLGVEKALIEAIVVDLNGQQSGIFETLENYAQADYVALKKKIDEIRGEADQKKT